MSLELQPCSRPGRELLPAAQVTCWLVFWKRGMLTHILLRSLEVLQLFLMIQLIKTQQYVQASCCH